MKRIFTLLSSALLFACQTKGQEHPTLPQMETSFYSLKATTITGEPFDFSTLRGKRVLIVNTASECGFTPQYEGLEELNKMYAGESFVILGFPSNDFMGQEPGTEEEILTFCTSKFDVTFQMMSKVTVDGTSGDPIYQWLCNKTLNGVEDAKVSWNFNKFLIDENGRWVAHLGSRVKPMSEEITNFAQGK
jgi:glutathione peroxidase